jgi:hypothetical protein
MPNYTFITCSYTSILGFPGSQRNLTLVEPNVAPHSFEESHTIFLLSLNFFFLAAFLLFVRYRRCEIISQRAPKLVYVTAICAVIFANFHVLRVSGTQYLYSSIPCYVEVWIMFLVLPTWLMSYCLRVTFVMAKYTIGEELVLEDGEIDAVKRKLPFVVRLIKFCLKKSSKGINCPNSYDGSFASDYSQTTQTDRFSDVDAGVQISQKILLRILLVFFGVYCAILVVIHSQVDNITISPPTFPTYLMPADKFMQLGEDGNHDHPFLQCSSGCYSVQEIIFIYVAPSYFIALIAIPYFLYILRNVQDTLYIRKEISLYLGAMAPLLALFVVTTKLLGRRVVEERLGDHEVLVYLLEAFARAIRPTLGVWSFTVSITAPAVMAYLRVNERKAITFNYDSFNNIFTDLEMLARFKKHLMTQLCIENGMFAEEFIYSVLLILPNQETFSPDQLEMALQLHYDRNPRSRKRVRVAVLRIYTNFIEENCCYELNLVGKTRLQIQEALLCGQLHPLVFMQAWNEIYHLMFENSYKDFVKRESTKS